MANFSECRVLGIKRQASKDGKTVYVTFACSHGYSNYELDNANCTGVTVENIQADDDFGVHVGDVVEFKYGKAIPTRNGGVFQPVYGVNIISRATDTKK